MLEKEIIGLLDCQKCVHFFRQPMYKIKMASCMTRKIGGRRILRNALGRFKSKQPRNSRGRYTYRVPKTARKTRRAGRR